VVHVYSGILFSLNKTRNLVICDNIHKFREHYKEWNKSETKTTWYHFYVDPKMSNSYLQRLDCYPRVGKRGGDEKGEMLVKGYKVLVT
jgi:hypothetical protein